MSFPEANRRLLQAIYSQQTPRNVFSVITTGGGAQISSWLFTVPGASNSVMSFSVPYSRHSLSLVLEQQQQGIRGDEGGHFSSTTSTSTSTSLCSEAVAAGMARAAYREAATAFLASTSTSTSTSGEGGGGGGCLRELSSSNVFGVGCTAALVSSQVSLHNSCTPPLSLYMNTNLTLTLSFFLSLSFF